MVVGGSIDGALFFSSLFFNYWLQLSRGHVFNVTRKAIQSLVIVLPLSVYPA